MDLGEAMRTTGSCRAFSPDAVPDEALASAFELARFAPSGGNRQGWKAVVVRDKASRSQIRDIHTRHWAQYIEGVAQGIVPFNTYRDPAGSAPAAHRPMEPEWLAKVNEFAQNIDAIPVHLLLFADLRTLAVTDNDLGRQSIVGGGSIYPFAQNLLLALRGQGLGTSLTTLICQSEPEIKALVNAPDPYALAALVLVGWPAKSLPKKLRRRGVESFATTDRFDGPTLRAEAEA